MKTVEINIYKFDELSEDAKQRAISHERENLDTSYMYDEAHKTVEAFEKIFPCDSRGQRSWLDARVNLDDNILELKGERLRKYILNNFGADLFKRKYLGGGLSDVKKPFHRMQKQSEITNNCPNKGKFSISYYSNIQTDNSCVLTGVCYDLDMLDPIYNFLDRKEFENHNLEELIEECYASLKKSLENEEEYRDTEEAIEEEIESNDYDFTEEGSIY